MTHAFLDLLHLPPQPPVGREPFGQAPKLPADRGAGSHVQTVSHGPLRQTGVPAEEGCGHGTKRTVAAALSEFAELDAESFGRRAQHGFDRQRFHDQPEGHVLPAQTLACKLSVQMFDSGSKALVPYG